jgi:hypothetical protein
VRLAGELQAVGDLAVLAHAIQLPAAQDGGDDVWLARQRELHDLARGERPLQHHLVAAGREVQPDCAVAVPGEGRGRLAVEGDVARLPVLGLAGQGQGGRGGGADLQAQAQAIGAGFQGQAADGGAVGGAIGGLEEPGAEIVE